MGCVTTNGLGVVGGWGGIGQRLGQTDWVLAGLGIGLGREFRLLATLGVTEGGRTIKRPCEIVGAMAQESAQ